MTSLVIVIGLLGVSALAVTAIVTLDLPNCILATGDTLMTLVSVMCPF